MRRVLFENRTIAGQALAEVIVNKGYSDPAVLALPRGGVPVAVEIARRLFAPLDLVFVRKLGAPFQPELAVGAVVDGASPEVVLNEDIVRETGTTEDYLEQETARQLAIIEKRRKLWISDRARVSVAGKTVIIVDDGIATGATVRAAILALKRRSPNRIVVATPVAPIETVSRLEAEGCEFIVLETPQPFGAIGFFYADFSQVADEQVAKILSEYDQP